MTTYTITISREAHCRLGTTVEVEANSQEEAENLALCKSETELESSAFTVTSIDLSGVQGSSEVVP